VPGNPLLKQCRDLQVVLLDHDHVSVAMNALLPEAHVRIFHAGLR
jgi:hypothetical protein